MTVYPFGMPGQWYYDDAPLPVGEIQAAFKIKPHPPSPPTPGIPTNAYVAEDGTTAYVAEDGATFYVTEA